MTNQEFIKNLTPKAKSILTSQYTKHPENHHIREKIRQQLQVLRDKGVIEFNGRGQYRKI